MGGMMGGQSTKPYGYGSSMGSGGGGAMGGIMAALTAKQQKKYGKISFCARNFFPHE